MSSFNEKGQPIFRVGPKYSWAPLSSGVRIEFGDVDTYIDARFGRPPSPRRITRAMHKVQRRYYRGVVNQAQAEQNVELANRYAAELLKEKRDEQGTGSGAEAG